MKIETSIKTNDFRALEKVVNKASPILTCWGARRIIADGYEGSVSIDALAERVISLVREKKFEYTVEERLIGKRLAAKISSIYNLSDQQVGRCAGIAKVFLNIYFFFCRYTSSPNKYVTSRTRWKWEDFHTEESIALVRNPRGNSYYHMVFEHYTPKQFTETFSKAAPRVCSRRFWEKNLIHERKAGVGSSQPPSSLSTFHTGNQMRQIEDARVDWSELPLHS